DRVGDLLHRGRRRERLRDTVETLGAGTARPLGVALRGDLERGAEERPRRVAGVQGEALIVDERVRAVGAPQPVLGGERLVALHGGATAFEEPEIVGMDAGRPALA